MRPRPSRCGGSSPRRSRPARVDQSKVPAGLHATRSATLQAGRDPLGAVGEISPEVLVAFEVTERVAIVELNLDEILDREPKPTQWKPTSRYPSSDLDLSFVVPEDIPAERVEKAVRQGAGNLLVDVDLFDVYRRRGSSQYEIAWPTASAYRRRPSLTDADVTDVRSWCRTAAATRRAAPRVKRGSARVSFA